MNKEDISFIIHSLKYLYKPKQELIDGLCPTFYFTLSYEGDKKLLEQAQKVIEELEKYE